MVSRSWPLDEQFSGDPVPGCKKTIRFAQKPRKMVPFLGKAAKAARPMPRYYFHFSHGKRTFTDSAGVELAGIAAARAYATAQIRDMRSMLPGGRVEDWSGWKMIVSDAKGKMLLEVNFDLTPKKR
jgi:hypothetical protein